MSGFWPLSENDTSLSHDQISDVQSDKTACGAVTVEKTISWWLYYFPLAENCFNHCVKLLTLFEADFEEGLEL